MSSTTCSCGHRMLSHHYLTNQHRTSVGSGNFGPCRAMVHGPESGQPVYCECDGYERTK